MRSFRYPLAALMVAVVGVGAYLAQGPEWGGGSGTRFDVQPRVTVVDAPSGFSVGSSLGKRVGSRLFGSVSDAEGTPWCHGQPTYWLVGHQSEREAPYCFNADDRCWTPRYDVALDTIEQDGDNRRIDLRYLKERPSMDRHDCVGVDVDRDGARDLICGLGAFKGQGGAYNELYITDPATGRPEKQRGHGLWEYRNMRSRLMVTLSSGEARDTDDLLFISTQAAERGDGAPNQHRMFRILAMEPFFEEVPGPWIEYGFSPQCLVAGDLNGDGLEDLVACGGHRLRKRRGASRVFIQEAHSWRVARADELDLAKTHARGWRNVRIVDLNGDGLNEIVVVGQYPAGGGYLRILEGTAIGDGAGSLTGNAAGFSVDAPVFEARLPYAAPDLEVFDHDGDGIKDIYVVQVDEEEGYCARRADLLSLGGDAPPLDNARDLLFAGVGSFQFAEPVAMDHELPGCGFLVERFGDESAKALVLAHGNNSRPGYNVLLTWAGSDFQPQTSTGDPNRAIYDGACAGATAGR